ncbi:hypothetical protein [Rubrivivax gelatinosus]|nr:hypothetical protein [Rubrivivax gelatinosus]
MKAVVSISLCVLMTGCVSVSKTPPARVYLYQSVSPDKCVLSETGPVAGRPRHEFSGQVREGDPQVYSCSIEIPMKEFERKLGYCVMRGQNYAAGYDFFQGNPRTRRHSCDARPLVNGNFYFQAVGIAADSCDWLCFPAADQ